MEIHIHIHHHNESQETKFDQIMAKLTDIQTEFNNLKTAIAEERTQASAKLAELQQSIDDLTANVQNGGTEEERASLLADINSQVAEVRAIIPDPETPTEPTEPTPEA